MLRWSEKSVEGVFQPQLEQFFSSWSACACDSPHNRSCCWKGFVDLSEYSDRVVQERNHVQINWVWNRDALMWWEMVASIFTFYSHDQYKHISFRLWYLQNVIGDPSCCEALLGSKLSNISESIFEYLSELKLGITLAQHMQCRWTFRVYVRSWFRVNMKQGETDRIFMDRLCNDIVETFIYVRIFWAIVGPLRLILNSCLDDRVRPIYSSSAFVYDSGFGWCWITKS